MKNRIPALLAMSLLLAGCGGGGDGNGSSGGAGTGPVPSLRTVVYTRTAGGLQNDIYAVQEDGTALAPLAASADSEIFVGLSPDGRVIFLRSVGGDNNLYSVKVDGTGLVGLGDTPNRELVNLTHAPAVTPNGRVVFTRHDFGLNRTDLYIIDADGTDEVLLATDVTDYFGMTPGGRALFSRSNGVYSVKEDGSDEQTLVATWGLVRGVTASGRVIIEGGGDLYSVSEAAAISDRSPTFRASPKPSTPSSPATASCFHASTAQHTICSATGRTAPVSRRSPIPRTTSSMRAPRRTGASCSRAGPPARRTCTS